MGNDLTRLVNHPSEHTFAADDHWRVREAQGDVIGVVAAETLRDFGLHRREVIVGQVNRRLVPRPVGMALNGTPGQALIAYYAETRPPEYDAITLLDRSDADHLSILDV